MQLICDRLGCQEDFKTSIWKKNSKYKGNRIIKKTLHVSFYLDQQYPNFVVHTNQRGSHEMAESVGRSGVRPEIQDL